MIKVTSDPTRQRLDFVAKAPFTPEELAGVPQQVKQAAAALRPGWTAAIDLSQGGLLPQSSVHITKNMQDVLKACGAGKLFTLVGGSTQTMQLHRLGTEAGTESQTHRFTDRAAWEKAIAG